MARNAGDFRTATHPGFARFALAVLALLVCFWGIWTSGRAGISRQLANRVKQGTAPPVLANEAIRLSPSDPKAYYARARALSDTGQIAEAVKDFESAIALRPEDHVSWLRLGYDRARLGDQEGALGAYQEAVRLAPYYAQPRWYFGNLLLRMGRRDEAFRELRQAVTSNPKLFVEAANRAWVAYNGDADAVERALQPQAPTARLELARFFVEHANATKALEIFRSTRAVSTIDGIALLAALIAAKRFTEAKEVWASGRKTSNEQPSAAITDGSFESDIRLDEPGFGWRIAGNLPGVRISLEANNPHTGSHSLRVDWNGNPDPATPVISQIVLVEPKRRYRLHFVARTQDILTIGLPIVTVADASSNNGSVLGQSATVPRGTSGWQDYRVEFATAETTSAVLIAIRRQDCNGGPCSIFGNFCVDDFSLEKL